MKGSLRQRAPGTWELTVYLGRDTRGKRLRKSHTLRGTKAQAQRKLREILSSLDKGIAVPTDHVLLRDWLDRWMHEVITPNRRQSTRERYRRIIDRHVAPLIGHIPMDRLTPLHVQTLESRLTTQGMDPKGVMLVHAVLSGAMKHALRMELIHRNVVSLVTPPTSTRRYVTSPEIAAVRSALAIAEQEGSSLFPCIHLIAYTGMRRGEALGLTWDNVDLEQGSVHVTASLVRSREHGLVLNPPKTESGRRRVDLDDGTVEVLRRHREQQEEWKEMMGRMYHDRGIVFADAEGGWLNPGKLQRKMNALGRAVGMDGMTTRSLRHFHASVMLQAGENIVVVSKRLGHANVSITSDIYAHSLPGWGKQAADAFAQAMEEKE